MAVDRPDITGKVFQLKQQQLLQDIKSGVLGKLIAHENIVELQKKSITSLPFLIHNTKLSQHMARNW